MNKETIKILIAEYQQRVINISYIERPYMMEDNLNYVLVGLRRVGKSYLMYQQIRHLIQQGHQAEEILYFNFEDDRLINLSIEDLDLIKVCYEEMYQHKPIFFLDEIQVVNKWEKFARRLADQGYRVYITGSNANMLSSEIATTLGGRYMIKHIFPFSFREYLTALELDISDSNFIYRDRIELAKQFNNYFTYGGLPEIINISDKRPWLSALYQGVFFGDLVSRYQIRNDFALRILVRKLADSVKQPSSFNRLSNIVSASGKKISTDTIIDYIKYLQEIWLIIPIENIHSKLAEKESNKKYYFIDNGILNLFLLDPKTSLLENLVAVELTKRFGDDVYFYQRDIEVDFYIPNQQLAIQVSYSIANIETKQREIEALLKLSKHLAIKEMLIITKDEEDIIKFEEYTIQVIPAWKWILISPSASLEDQ